MNLDWVETLLLGFISGLFFNYILYLCLFSSLGLALAKPFTLIKKMGIVAGLVLLLAWNIAAHSGMNAPFFCLGGLVGAAIGNFQLFVDTDGRGL
jgi:hypothetical protein